MPQEIFSSREILKIREALRDSAVWQYYPQMDRLLLSDAARFMLNSNVRIDTDITALVSTLRSDDGFNVADFRDALMAGLLDGRSFEVSCPRRGSRILTIHYRRFPAADGRSERLDGLLVDVTSQHNALRMMSQRRRCADKLFRKIGFFEWQTDRVGRLQPSFEWLALTGQPFEEQPDHWQDVVAPESRQEVAEAVARATANPRGGFYVQSALKLAGGGTAHFIAGGALVRHNHGGEFHMAGRALRRPAVEEARLGLLESTAALMASGPELRAARALLGWSMQETAAAAQVSMSTVKRLEDGEANIRSSNMVRVVEALQGGGVSFFMADKGRVAVVLRSRGGTPRRAGDFARARAAS